MHQSSIARMDWFVKEYLHISRKNEKLKVLDVGSYDVNGSYKHLFPSDKFIYNGLDMEEGPNVDIFVENPYRWNNLDTDSYDVVISGQAFEHIEFFWITLAEMARVIKKDGFMCIIAPNGFGEHRYPVDCYRFFTDGMISLARYISFEVLHAHTNLAPSHEHSNWYSDNFADSMLIARKRYEGETQYVNLDTYTCIPPDHKKLNHPLIANAKPKGIKRFIREVGKRILIYFNI